METSFEVGKTYDLTYASVIVKDDAPYIVATDGRRDYTIKPYDYQTEYSTYPHVLKCYVRKVGLNGHPYFDQSKEQVLKDCYYQLGTTHKFVIEDILFDNKTGSTYYSLLDEYGITHRYYPEDDETLKKRGDSIELVVKRIVPSQEGRNNARLDLVLPGSDTRKAATFVKPAYPKNVGKKNFGCEDEKREFKSSIVYPAGQKEANIGTQLGIICRTIAGFMNANGGTLYIGVSDNGYICGIEGDYSHLNDGDIKFKYKTDDDGYLQRITNAICDILGFNAGTLVSMRIEQEEGKKYCIIDIKKASRPIWFTGNKLFVRMVTTNRKLNGDEITQFILDKVSRTEFARQKEAEAPRVDDSPAETETVVSEATTVSVQAPAPIRTAPAKKAGPAWRYITFYDNGEWSFQKEDIQGDDVVCSAAIPSDAKRNNHILVLAYENGHIEATALKVLLYGKSGLKPEGKRRSQGLCPDNGNVVDVFCANKKDMLLLTSELAGEKYIKAMDVDTLGIHDGMGKGNEIIREKGATLVKAVRIPNDDGTRIAIMGSGIFIEKGQKYSKGGVKLSTLASNYQRFLDELSGEAAS